MIRIVLRLNMSNKNQVGITGGIGSGKSTICKILNAAGVPSYDADSRARFIMVNDDDVKSNLKSAFGDKIYEGKTINSTYLSKLAFNNPEELAKLNSIVHPAVNHDYQIWVENKEENVVVKEAALLVETGSYKRLNALIVVTSEEEVRINRILNRDKDRNREDVLKIMRQQLPENELLKVADYVIKNDGKLSLIKQTLKILKKIKAR